MALLLLAVLLLKRMFRPLPLSLLRYLNYAFPLLPALPLSLDTPPSLNLFLVLALAPPFLSQILSAASL
jgi:hypothetical protein